jgi:hypothetical protein
LAKTDPKIISDQLTLFAQTEISPFKNVSDFQTLLEILWGLHLILQLISKEVMG